MSSLPEPGAHVHADGDPRRCPCRLKYSSDMPYGPELDAQDPLSIDGPDEADYLDGW